jgi:hypothetical protein
MQLMSGDTESGGNVGSNFALFRHDDAGVLLAGGPILWAARQDGLLQVLADPTVALGVATKQYVDAKAGRPQLSAARTWYTRTDGNDGNDGSANDAAHAFKTIQRTWTEICKYDHNGFAVTLKLGAGMVFTNDSLTTTATNMPVNGLNITLDGSGSTISPQFGQSVFHTAPNVLLQIYNCVLNSSFGSPCVTFSGRGVRGTIAGANTFGASTGGNGTHMRVDGGAYMNVSNPYTVTGAASYHYYVSKQSMFDISAINPTLLSGATFTNFAVCEFGSYLGISTVNFVNAATILGQRYLCSSNAVINTGGGGANMFPGSVAGVSATGGQYI